MRRADRRRSLAGKRTRSARSAALAISLAANLLLLWLLAAPGGYLALPAEIGPRPIDVSVAPAPRPRRAASVAAARSAALAAIPPTVVRPAVAALSTPATAPSSAAPTSSAGAAPEVTAALRGGPIGCANQGAAWMTDEARAACRQRFAAGAANVPHLQGMAPEKLAYYDALAKAQSDWLSGRDPGNLPYLFCGVKFGQGAARYVVAPPHALKFGPCFLNPPRGSLSPTVDVPLPDHLSPDAVGPIAGQDPFRHQGQ